MVHGTVHIVPGRCKGCGLCVVACPQHVLGFSSALNSQGYHPVELFDDLNACTGCAMCALVCPDAVFTVYREDLQHSGAARMTASRRSQRTDSAIREENHARTLERE